MNKNVKKVLRDYARLFHEGRERNANEADTVMYLVRFFTDVLGYDLFSEITKEFQIRERYCDIAVKLLGQVRYLVEVKAMGVTLSDRHIEQAENYASRAGIPWVVLTNGVVWRLYHLTFDSGGINHDLAYEASLTPEADLEKAWANLALLSRRSVLSGELEEFWTRRKTLSANSLVRAMFTEEVLLTIRRELRRRSKVSVQLEDLVSSLKRLMNPEILTEDIKLRKTRRKRRKVPKSTARSQKKDSSTLEDSPGLKQTSMEPSQ